MRQTLITKVENKPGVLNRVASLFRRRNFNIDSLNVGQTEDPRFSRMTIVVNTKDVDAHKVEANLYKLVNVVDVQDVTGQSALLRELALIKVKAKNGQRAEIANLANIFGAKIIDVAEDSVVVQVASGEEKVNSLVELLRPFTIIELVRTGQVAMMRGSTEGVRHTPGAGGNGYQNGKNH
ncbi:MAG: acetolactate synthase small subunit [Anaerolineales bacterium]|nr:acetolactate synthase small subunit [Anaerolineales bacterium]